MRGKVFFASVCVDFPGITPAYAGKSMTQSPMATAIRDHPRVCGEKRDMARKQGREIRITPAYAGKRL